MMTNVFDKFKDLDPVKIIYLGIIIFMFIIGTILINSNNNLSKRVSIMEADQEYIMQTISNLEYEMETEIPTNTTRQHDTMINVLNLILDEITNAKEKN